MRGITTWQWIELREIGDLKRSASISLFIFIGLLISGFVSDTRMPSVIYTLGSTRYTLHYSQVWILSISIWPMIQWMPTKTDKQGSWWLELYAFVMNCCTLADSINDIAFILLVRFWQPCPGSWLAYTFINKSQMLWQVSKISVLCVFLWKTKERLDAPYLSHFTQLYNLFKKMVYS